MNYSKEEGGGRTANEIFNYLDSRRAIKWEGLSDGGKWDRALEAAELYKTSTLEAIRAEVQKEQDESLDNYSYVALENILKLLDKHLPPKG